MNHIDLAKRSGKEADKSDTVFCPKCTSALRRFIEILDSCSGEVFRVFRCECGEFFWDK